MMWEVLFSAFANTSWIHFRIPDWITKRTSFPSEWFSAFYQDKRFVYLHLTGERRLYGWPEEWPDQPDKGHFVMMQPEWILDDNTRVKLHLVERMLIPTSEVVMVEFVKRENEYTHSPEEQVEAERLMIQIQKRDSKEPNNDGAEKIKIPQGSDRISQRSTSSTGSVFEKRPSTESESTRCDQRSEPAEAHISASTTKEAEVKEEP